MFMFIEKMMYVHKLLLLLFFFDYTCLSCVVFRRHVTPKIFCGFFFIFVVFFKNKLKTGLDCLLFCCCSTNTVSKFIISIDKARVFFMSFFAQCNITYRIQNKLIERITQKHFADSVFVNWDNLILCVL